MDRRAFGFWGLDLDDDSYAQALAAIGVIPSFRAPVRDPLTPGIRELLTTALDPKHEFVSYTFNVNLAWIIQEAAGHHPKVHQAPANVFSQSWKEAVGLRKKPFRLEIDQQSFPPSADLSWLSSQLALNAVGAASVYARQDDPDSAVAWEWPLRIGLIPDARSRKLRAELEEDPYPQLFELIELKLVHECDLLLLPYSLRASVEALLKLNGRITADCVLVMGGLKTEYSRALNLLNTLRTEVDTAGVGVLFVPRSQRGAWFHQALIHISHNEPIDVALRTTARDLSLTSPLLIASRRLVEHANLQSSVKRLAKVIQSVPRTRSITLPEDVADRLHVSRGTQPAERTGKELLEAAEDFSWSNETGDATATVKLRKAAEEQTENRIRIARANGGSETAEAREDRRRVQVQIYENEDEGIKLVDRALRTSRSYQLLVRIGLGDQKWKDADTTFPSHLLPRRAEGHELKVVFYELPRAENKPVKAQIAELYLQPDPTKASTSAPFYFRTGEAPYNLAARIVILHENRVLQTLRLKVSVIDSAEASDHEKIELNVETFVNGFSGLENRTPYDAALIVNDNEHGNVGVTAISKSRVAFREPKGIDGDLNWISQQLSKLSDIFREPVPLTNAEMLKVLTGLAHHGRLILESLPEEAIEIVSRGKRIQIVEAQQGAFLPAEFFYDRYAPVDYAPLCDHVEQGLRATPALLACPHGDDDTVVCPTAFWGFSRVLERRPHVSLEKGDDYELGEPSIERNSLGLFNKTIFGISSKMRDEDRLQVAEILNRVTSGNAVEAQTWQDWVQQVQVQSPSLLVLIPHTEPDEQAIPTLEISDDVLKLSRIEEKHVLGQNKTNPLVLLLGCSTNKTPIAFHSFVERFKKKKAAVVIGTLSVVRARHSVNFLERFFKTLEIYRKEPGATLGDVLLEVRQKLLAEGDPFVLSLMVYGDAEWQL